MKREGFQGSVGLSSNSALGIIDMSLGFTDPSSPLGADLDDVVGSVARLLAAVRRFHMHIFFTTIAFQPGSSSDMSPFQRKVPALGTLQEGSRWVEIDPRLRPLQEEVILSKIGASAFFGTPLSSLLSVWRTESLILCGASTSGCVRATAVDAVQLGFGPIIATDAVGDRDADSHSASLRDIDAKYGDLMTVDDIVKHLEMQGSPRGDDR